MAGRTARCPRCIVLGRARRLATPTISPPHLSAPTRHEAVDSDKRQPQILCRCHEPRRLAGHLSLPLLPL